MPTARSVAAVVTEYRRNSHADVIVGKVLEGWTQGLDLAGDAPRGRPDLPGERPELRLAGMYTDQVPDGDLSRELSDRFDFPIFESIEQAVTLGGDEVAVDGVLSIGEHGDYPYNELGQHLYPRKRFFDEIVRALERGGRVVPVFNDKHLSTDWYEALDMVQTARDMGIPFMAGSSLPVAWRVPQLVLERGCEIDEALALGYSGLESYGFHALETLQCMVERRRGGETGVASVQTARGDAIWQAERDGLWSRPLLDAALATLPSVTPGRIEDNLGPDAAFYLIEYRDGLRATVAMVNGHARELAFAARLADREQLAAAWFALQEGRPYLHFAYLLHAIERMIHTCHPSYPVERTLLTTGVLETVMRSLAEDGRRFDTPHLEVRYEPADYLPAQGEPPPPVEQ